MRLKVTASFIPWDKSGVLWVCGLSKGPGLEGERRVDRMGEKLSPLSLIKLTVIFVGLFI